jgi:replicative DNA helicase
VALEEYILVGGERGSGKSITASNVACNQYEMGNSVVYFTIEMLAKEISERNFAILADVPYMKLKNGQLNKEEYLKVVKARAEMFLDSEDLVEQYKTHNNRFKFEKDLIKTKKLKPDNQIILVDDRRLTIPTIDLHLGRLKARFGDKLKVAVVDYINQIKVDGKQYDWSIQIEISTALKELARKHKMVMFSPYQIDNSGEARFAKGILDSADISLILKAHDKESGAISFKTTKIRGGPPGDFTCPINWETLKIDPSSIEPPSKKEKTNDKMKGKKVDDSSADIPPWD